MKIQTVSSLYKISPDYGADFPESRGVMLKNERYNFQVAVKNDDSGRIYGASLRTLGDLADKCSIRAVDCVPAVFTTYEDTDDYVIFPFGKDAGLYPDVLREENFADLPSKKWVSFWITVYNKNGLPVGKHDLKIEVLNENGEKLCETEYEIEVLDAAIPEIDFPVTHWMHYDAIANYYNLKPWSEKYYEIFGGFLEHYISHGSNMLYVPLFTPPLDTKIGGERLDVQLVEVERKNGKYTFDLKKLEKFLDFALSRGIKYFEMCHLATQWGAAHCPKIMATTENGYERIFGWDTSSTGDEYLGFLRECLAKVDGLLRNKNLTKKTYFHISDEPNKDNIARYKEVYDAIRPIIKEYKLMDAVSDSGRDIIDVPVVSTTHLDGKCAENEFAYYCCSSYKNYLANRFMNMPSQRNRILGAQLWLNEAKGFLHWGFNFYNDGLSHRNINPFVTTDASVMFPSGDAFVVYPSENGAWDSLRLEVFYDALQDRAVLCALEEKYGREKLEELLLSEGVKGWTQYPRSAEWQTEFGAKLRKMLANK